MALNLDDPLAVVFVEGLHGVGQQVHEHLVDLALAAYDGG